MNTIKREARALQALSLLDLYERQTRELNAFDVEDLAASEAAVRGIREFFLSVLRECGWARTH